MRRAFVPVFLSLAAVLVVSLPAYAPPFADKTDIIYKKDGSTFPQEGTGRKIRVVKETKAKIWIKLWDNSEMQLQADQVERIQHFDTPAEYKLGMRMITDRNYKEAVKYFKKVKLTGARSWLKVYTLNYLGKSLLMVGLSELGANDEAALVYERLLKEHPDSIFHGEALLGGATASFQKGKFKEARARLKKVARTVSPGSRGEMLVRLMEARVLEYGDKNYRKAKRIYVRLGTTGTDDVRMQAHLGEIRCLVKMGDPRSAISSADRLLRKTKDRSVLANLWNVKGDCLMALSKGKPDMVKDALFAYLRVVVVYFYDPRIAAEAAYKAGQCFEKLEQRNRALDQYRRANETTGGGEWKEKAAARLKELG